MNTMPHRPPISIVMSVYNGQDYLAEAIDSILTQTFTDFEFVIVDDGSTDSSAEIIRSYSDGRIKLLQRQNSGLFSSLNYAIQFSSGKYIARIDADDIAMPHRLESQFEYLESNPGCALLSGHSEYIDRDGNALYVHKVPVTDEAIRKGLPYSCQIIHPACMFRRDHFLQTTGFLEQYINSAFEVLLWNQFCRFGFFSNLNLVLIKYRIRPGSLTGINRFAAWRKRLILDKLIENRPLSVRDVAFLSGLQKESPTKREARYLWRLGLIHKGLSNFPAARTCLKASLDHRFSAVTLYHYMTVLFANKSNHGPRSVP